MDGGDLAGLLAALVFAVLVGLLALPIVKLGRVFDELRLTIRSINDGTTPLIDEVTRTVSTTNTQLEKVDGITSNVSDASANVSALSSLVASTVGQPLIKVASFSHGLRRAFGPPQGSTGARTEDDASSGAGHTGAGYASPGAQAPRPEPGRPRPAREDTGRAASSHPHAADAARGADGRPTDGRS